MPRTGFSSSTARRLADGATAGSTTFTGQIGLAGDGLAYIELRPDLDFETIRGNAGIPTLVTQGVYRGFSLPVYVADSNEELFFTICVPNRYDGASDILVHIYCWLSQTEDSKNFKLQLSWEHYTTTDVVPATSNDVEVQTATGAGAAQFQNYEVELTIDYDIDTPDDIVADDTLSLRLRRIAADADECVGEIVINHIGVVFRRDKLGAATP